MMTPFAVCVIISNLFGLVTYSLDVYSDLALGVYWLRLGHRNWGAATLAFFFIPGAINSFLGTVNSRYAGSAGNGNLLIMKTDMDSLNFSFCIGNNNLPMTF